MKKKLDVEVDVEVDKSSRKRGRKPKGGKIIQKNELLENVKEEKPNIILHLKCSLKDLDNNGESASNIDPYNFETNYNLVSYDVEEIHTNNDVHMIYNPLDAQPPLQQVKTEIMNQLDDEHKKEALIEKKEIWRKLKMLEQNLHTNNISDKKSACFWCSYDFDNIAIYIPKHYIKDKYEVYGCFCSPECAVAHLMEENLDSSIKFERYHLMNHIYSKIYEYNKNIKPAPNPYYMLDKYYGNLSIQEYRSLLRSERLFLMVDKPMTRIFPEFHEDNDDFILNQKIIPSNHMQAKKKIQKKQTKATILNEKFGL